MKKISYYHNFSKSKFSKLTNQERFEMIYNENFWESNESSSGIGSEIKNTKAAPFKVNCWLTTIKKTPNAKASLKQTKTSLLRLLKVFFAGAFISCIC